MFAEVPEPAYPPEIEPDRQGDSAHEQIRDFYRVGVVASRRKAIHRAKMPPIKAPINSPTHNS
jgi:hypothetical protein